MSISNNPIHQFISVEQLGLQLQHAADLSMMR
ncbi:hypothetical protein T4D_12993 [Trichinella pseudospiralis]|uniref:Uncharacterized protein n=1 Tax=Trichinella pseudospiralis TaxID=6337 RepID=A0A0V1DXA2_TRIPS|nr:hypothetical protein T4D_12993 [Trichinella pseudospiralis]